MQEACLQHSGFGDEPGPAGLGASWAAAEEGSPWPAPGEGVAVRPEHLACYPRLLSNALHVTRCNHGGFQFLGILVRGYIIRKI